MTTFAGQYGPEPFTDLRGNAAPDSFVYVLELDGVTPAELWTDRNRTASLANPLPKGRPTGQPGLDVAANGTFWIDPGRYLLRVVVEGQQVFEDEFTVALDPTEPPGNAVVSYHYQSAEVLKVHTVVHELGYKPALVEARDTAGTRHLPTIRHLSASVLELEFVGPTGVLNADFS